ncbi:MAG TPA: shikimate dehydrogenase [Tepidisphaeraceae bacterium]
MTHLCVPITVVDELQAKRDMALAAERGADLLELRIDQVTDDAVVADLVKAAPRPVIVTCRSAEEGGKAAVSDIQRLGLLTAAADAGASYCDIELASVQANNWAGPKQPRDRRAGWIYSSHHFTDRPTHLSQLLVDLAESPCDVAKIAWAARTVRDNIEAFELMLARTKPSMLICMGEAGLLSRVLAKKFGAFATFAALDAASGTAPGQVSVADMKHLYRWDAINPRTKVYGVVGRPVGHSMSPAIHNASFDRIGYDGVYVPLLVEDSYESFKAFMETFVAFEPLHLSGLSITIPHKGNALRYLEEVGASVEPLAERIGAVNTILIRRDDGLKLEGRNTDYAAILDSLTMAMKISRDDLSGRRIAVIGAGGTGRTAVAALAHYGATVVIYNRTFERATELAEEFNGRSGKVVAARMEKLCDSCCEVILNTTSIGMSPNRDASPLDGVNLQLTPSHVVFDTIYNPMRTKLLQQAEAAGATIIGGVEMFVRQAAAQFEAWTNHAAPADLMREVVTTRLR